MIQTYAPQAPAQQTHRPPQIVIAAALCGLCALGYVISGILNFVGQYDASLKFGVGPSIYLIPLAGAAFLTLWATATGVLAAVRSKGTRITVVVSCALLIGIALLWTLIRLSTGQFYASTGVGDGYDLVQEFGNALIAIGQVVCYGAAIALLFAGPRAKAFYR
jgi:hypothetical protein